MFFIPTPSVKLEEKRHGQFDVHNENEGIKNSNWPNVVPAAPHVLWIGPIVHRQKKMDNLIFIVKLKE